ncbi:DUF6517 family protein [Salinibaculum rarum]|uniref:DUF6517 family protein n=1 Tax=Salinibaculum rarum TaxID=3058903 RepID=UPI00265DE543|nr:DUF6517 family protein [Salinibaculum sp. KK48]
MIDRRTYLASAGTALAAATAGCGFILGNEPATFTANASVVPDSVLDETGYEFVENEEVEVRREVSGGGQTREVVATNVQAKYEKSVDLGPLGEQRGAVFTALTTPQAKVLGKTFNPIADMSAQELARRVQDSYEEFSNMERQGESEVTINGNTTTQAEFTADAVISGNPVELSLHVSEAVELGSDFVVAFGSYPRVRSAEQSNILALMEAVESA